MPTFPRNGRRGFLDRLKGPKRETDYPSVPTAKINESYTHLHPPSPFVAWKDKYIFLQFVAAV